MVLSSLSHLLHALRVFILQLSSEEVVDIQDRLLAATMPVGAPKTPLKAHGKEYQVLESGADSLVAKAGVSVTEAAGSHISRAMPVELTMTLYCM